MAPPSSADLPLDFQRGVIISSSYGKAWVCVIIEVTWADDARAPCMCVDRVGGPAPPLSLNPSKLLCCFATLVWVLYMYEYILECLCVCLISHT